MTMILVVNEAPTVLRLLRVRARRASPGTSQDPSAQPCLRRTVGASSSVSMAWSHYVPSLSLVSDASNRPQHDHVGAVMFI